ncbi:MAG: trypsin-like peptidase domain-containing protein [Micromonosporaceae bacterium]|nr:trypsin-like peptidase domain-containing protein [Micromonosporaceae bacterium]
MTSGYEPEDSAASGTPHQPDPARGEEPGASRTERLGPKPPRLNNPVTAGMPVIPPPGMPQPGQRPQGVAPGMPPPPGHGPFGPTGGMPIVPPPGPPPMAVPARPSAGYPHTGGFPAVPPPYSGPPAAMAPTSGSGGRAPKQHLAVLATILAVVLLFVSAGEAVLLLRLDDRLDDANTLAANTRASQEQQLADLESRTGDLERRTIDPAKVAAEVTPSVFKVIAKTGTGTAFAFGEEPAGGGTDFVTNYHVVKDTYIGGGRDVSLERDNKRYTAKIIFTSEEKDLAVVHSVERFPRLSAARGAAEPGEPVVVIGAPLGAESTVTSGVVSALRNTSEGSFVQFDAAINPGNSGGPVVNAQKLVVGVATAKVMDAEGIGFAIPVSVVCETLGIC